MSRKIIGIFDYDISLTKNHSDVARASTGRGLKTKQCTIGGNIHFTHLSEDEYLVNSLRIKYRAGLFELFEKIKSYGGQIWIHSAGMHNRIYNVLKQKNMLQYIDFIFAQKFKFNGTTNFINPITETAEKRGVWVPGKFIINNINRGTSTKIPVNNTIASRGIIKSIMIEYHLNHLNSVNATEMFFVGDSKDDIPTLEILFKYTLSQKIKLKIFALQGFAFEKHLKQRTQFPANVSIHSYNDLHDVAKIVFL